MSLHRALSLASLVALAALAGCGNSASPEATASSAAAKPGAAATMSAAATKPATAPPTAAAAAVVGIATGEMVAASCESIDKDGECSEIVVTAEADKAKSMDALKKLCQGKVTDKACSTDKIVGTCRIMKDIISHYSSEGPPKHTVETAKKVCEKSHGRWIAP
jgi:hypothetical protein